MNKLFVILLVLVLILSLMIEGCSKTTPEQEPISAPTPAQEPEPATEPESEDKPVLLTTEDKAEPLPSGWTRHATNKFEIALPADWIAMDISEETIDAMIVEIGPTNPDLVPSLEALKNQQMIEFWAMDLDSPPGFAVNLNVGHEVIVIRSLDDYAKLLKKQMVDMGYTVVIGDKFKLKDCDALRLETSCTVYLPSGQPFNAEQMCVIVDKARDRYLIILTYLPEDAHKYTELFDSVIQTFNIVE